MVKYNAETGLNGAISGAGTGAAVGGPWGAAIGGTIGAASGFFGNKKKKKQKDKIRSTLDPEQQSLYNDYIQSIRGQGPFSDMYNYNAESANQNFDKNTARKSYRDFNENIIPKITGQFRNNNLMNSSYTGEALGRAGRDVQENLDALRSDMNYNGQQQANTNRQNAITNILGMNTQEKELPKDQSNQPSVIDQILGKFGPMAADSFGDYLKNSGTSGTTAPTSQTGYFTGPSQGKNFVQF